MNTNSQSDMGKYYKLLIKFSHGEKVTRKALLRSKVIDEQLIDDALDLGLIWEADTTDINEERYVITNKGEQVRDNWVTQVLQGSDNRGKHWRKSKYNRQNGKR